LEDLHLGEDRVRRRAEQPVAGGRAKPAGERARLVGEPDHGVRLVHRTVPVDHVAKYGERCRDEAENEQEVPAQEGEELERELERRFVSGRSLCVLNAHRVDRRHGSWPGRGKQAIGHVTYLPG
jgi:hypothetical protein